MPNRDLSIRTNRISCLTVLGIALAIWAFIVFVIYCIIKLVLP